MTSTDNPMFGAQPFIAPTLFLCLILTLAGCGNEIGEVSNASGASATEKNAGGSGSGSGESPLSEVNGTFTNDEYSAAVANPANVDPDGNWAQFRGYRTQGTSNDLTVPTRWSESENLTWKTELPGRGASSPIVFGDRVFVTAFSGYGMSPESPGVVDDLMFHVLCIDRNTGDVIWQTDVEGSRRTQRATERVIDHGFATSTPVTDGEMIYAFFGVTGVVALDMSGEIVWTAEVGQGRDGFGSAASPTIFEDLLLVNASIESQKVIAFDKQMGDVVWEIDDVIRTWTTPTVYPNSDGEAELVIHATDVIRGFDPSTGEELWTSEGIHDYTVSAPAYHDGICYFIGGRTRRFLAVRLGGRGDVTESHRLWELPIGANVPSPIYFGGHIFWPNDSGILYCASIEDGKTVSRSRTNTKMRVYGSIVRAGEHFYLPLRDNGILVFRAGTEYESIAENRFAGDDADYNATPAISQGQLFMRTDNYLYCVGERNQ